MLAIASSAGDHWESSRWCHRRDQLPGRHHQAVGMESTLALQMGTMRLPYLHIQAANFQRVVKSRLGLFHQNDL